MFSSNDLTTGTHRDFVSVLTFRKVHLICGRLEEDSLFEVYVQRVFIPVLVANESFKRRRESVNRDPGHLVNCLVNWIVQKR